MKKINNYIVEKLFFKKGMKVSHEIKKGDMILRVCYEPTNNYIYLGGDSLGEEKPFYFDRIENGRLSFRKTKKEELTHYTLEGDVKVNSNGFYEFYKNVFNNLNYVIYLDRDSGIDFIQNVCIDEKFNELNNYFDDKDKFNNKIRVEEDSVKKLGRILMLLKNNEKDI